jgi:hypothetical protein
MKVSTMFKSVLFIAVLIFNSAAFAYSPEMEEQACKKPKFREFSLPEYKAPDFLQVPPESEFTFTLSVWANKETIKLNVKKQPLPFTVQTFRLYPMVKAKLPASLTGQFVRIDASVKAVQGCDDQFGWLVKVADKPAQQVADKPVEKATEKEAVKPDEKVTEQEAEKPADQAIEKPGQDGAEKK